MAIYGDLWALLTGSTVRRNLIAFASSCNLTALWQLLSASLVFLLLFRGGLLFNKEAPPLISSTRMKLDSSKPSDCLDQFKQGVRTFSLLFTRWMDTNEWSHPVMTSLAKSALKGTAWLHSSQISGLRHGQLFNPGPRTFIAIERLNYHLWQYRENKVLIPGTSSSNTYSRPFVITEDGDPPPLGWWFEVFCGCRVPTDIDLKSDFFSEARATTVSKDWAALARKLMIRNELDIITELEQTIRAHYPANDHSRVEKVVQVIQNKAAWTPHELAAELPSITALTAALGGPESEALLLKALQK